MYLITCVQNAAVDQACWSFDSHSREISAMVLTSFRMHVGANYYNVFGDAQFRTKQFNFFVDAR